MIKTSKKVAAETQVVVVQRPQEGVIKMVSFLIHWADVCMPILNNLPLSIVTNKS